VAVADTARMSASLLQKTRSKRSDTSLLTPKSIKRDIEARALRAQSIPRGQAQSQSSPSLLAGSLTLRLEAPKSKRSIKDKSMEAIIEKKRQKVVKTFGASNERTGESSILPSKSKLRLELANQMPLGSSQSEVASTTNPMRIERSFSKARELGSVHSVHQLLPSVPRKAASSGNANSASDAGVSELRKVRSTRSKRDIQVTTSTKRKGFDGWG